MPQSNRGRLGFNINNKEGFRYLKVMEVFIIIILRYRDRALCLNQIAVD